jgi:hypothetical protein
VIADEAMPNSPVLPQKLAIVHILGWTLGVGVVLGIYRAVAVWHAANLDQPVQLSWPAVGYGLAQGTAVSGLGLLIWRWWRGTCQGPTQPGHWLLIFGSIGLIIDQGVAVGIETWQTLHGLSNPYNYLVHYAHQAAGWGLGAILGMIVLANLRGAGRLWIAATLFIVLTISASALAYSASFIGGYRGIPGTWIWKIPLCIRVVGEACIVVTLIGAESSDRIRGLPRDWLHLGGYAATLATVAVDLSLNVPALWRYW